VYIVKHDFPCIGLNLMEVLKGFTWTVLHLHVYFEPVCSYLWNIPCGQPFKRVTWHGMQC